MTRRAIFDRPGMALERPRGPLWRHPEGHRCQAPGCTAWGSYGLREPGIAAMRTHSTWWCKDHLPETTSA